jgi:DNA polymerase I
MLMSYAMHAGCTTTAWTTLSERYLGHTPIPIKSLLGSARRRSPSTRSPSTPRCYAAEDADVTLRLWQHVQAAAAPGPRDHVYETLERPLVPVLAEMEMAGIQVDRDTLSRMSNAFAQKMAGLEAEIHASRARSSTSAPPSNWARSCSTRWASPAAKGQDRRLCHRRRHPGRHHHAGGQPPAGRAPGRRILDWRQMSKLKSTYTDALQDHINPDTGRVHTSYSIAGANTGRLASTDPNLQNIPVRTEEGRRIREAFVAPPGRPGVASTTARSNCASSPTSPTSRR